MYTKNAETTSVASTTSGFCEWIWGQGVLSLLRAEKQQGPSCRGLLYAVITQPNDLINGFQRTHLKDISDPAIGA